MRVIVQDADADLTELAVWMLNVEHGAVVYGEEPPCEVPPRANPPPRPMLPPEEWRPWPLVALPGGGAPLLHVRPCVGHVFLVDHWSYVSPPGCSSGQGPWLDYAWVARLEKKLSEYDHLHLTWTTQGASPSCYIRGAAPAPRKTARSAVTPRNTGPRRQIVGDLAIAQHTDGVTPTSYLFTWHFVPYRAAALEKIIKMSEAVAVATGILVVPPGKTPFAPGAEIEVLRKEDVRLMPQPPPALLSSLGKAGLLLGEADELGSPHGPRLKVGSSGVLFVSERDYRHGGDERDAFSALLRAKWTRLRSGVYLVQFADTRAVQAPEILAHTIPTMELYSRYPSHNIPAVRLRVF